MDLIPSRLLARRRVAACRVGLAQGSEMTGPTKAQAMNWAQGWYEDSSMWSDYELHIARCAAAWAREQALEEAAAVADATVCDVHLPTGIKIHGRKAGGAIRALKGTT